MSRYHLTEAYGELYNTRLTEDSYYDNLRFVDYLQPEQIEEVMESLIWEFMDYGDTLDEAVDTLELAFSDDEILCESLELISEARYTGRNEMERRREMRQRQSMQSRQSERERSANLRSFAKRDADTAARARRAERAAAVRGALRGAKQTVKGALSRAQEYVTNKRSQLATQGRNLATKVGSAASSAALQAQAGLSRVARAARGGVMGAIQGAKTGAAREFNTPSVAPSSRIPGRQQTAQMRAAARQTVGDPFAQQLRTATTADTNRPRLGLRGLSNKPAAAPNPTAFPARTRERMGVQVTSKAGKPLRGAAAAPAIRSARRKQSVNASYDYDLLTQMMIEDLIYEGYAQNEYDALSILEEMEPETLAELADGYEEILDETNRNLGGEILQKIRNKPKSQRSAGEERLAHIKGLQQRFGPSTPIRGRVPVRSRGGRRDASGSGDRPIRGIPTY
jgi:hypothetical protein